MRKIYWLLTALVFVIQCDSSHELLVRWAPEKPEAGDTVEIFYNTEHPNAMKSASDQLTIILEISTEDSISVHVRQMQVQGTVCSYKLKVGIDTRLIGFKFEGPDGLTESNGSCGWNIPIQGKDGENQRDTNYFLGKAIEQRCANKSNPRYDTAFIYYRQEQENFPGNFKVWHAIWQNRLKVAPNPAQYILIIQRQLDSLLRENSKEREVLKLAFDTYRTLIQNEPKAVYYGSRYLTEYPTDKSAARIAYFLIYLKFGNQVEKLVSELKTFLENYPDFRDKKYVYMSLVDYYLRLKDKATAYKFLYEGLLNNAEDFSNYTTYARYLGELGHFEEAMNYIQKAFERCTIEQSQILIPWMNGFERSIQNHIDLASIYSALAQINYYEKNYEKSVQNRKKAIELGSPFPAYEWENIGKAYIVMKKMESAKHAFAEALIRNPSQENALQGLFLLYNEEAAADRPDFKVYVQNIINSHQQEFMKPVQNFEVKDLTDQYFQFEKNRGQILVLYFSATMLLENKAIINRLNRLAMRFKSSDAVDFWMISIEGKNNLVRVLKENPLDFKIFHSGNDAKNKMNVIGFPTYILIDRNGIERFRHVGEHPGIDTVLGEKINQLLKIPLS